MLALTVMLLRTSSVDLRLSDSAAGWALRSYFKQRYLGLLPLNRLCRGVLILPQQRADYLRGRRREAVRRNLRRAGAAGITCETIGDRSRAVEDLLELADGRRLPVTAANVERWRLAVARPETTLVLARDADRRPVAVGSVVIDDNFGLIEFAVANSHEARWALHDHIVQIVIERGAHYLVAEGDGPFGALGFRPAVQRYQYLHGYELRHLRWRRPERITRRERRVAFLAGLAIAASAML